MGRSHPLLPFLATLVAVGLLSLMDAVMKHASLATGAYDTLVVRSLMAFAIATPLWLASRKGWPTLSAMKLHAVRGAVISAMSFTFFWGLTRLPLAEAIAISFVAPLLALYLAAALLGERIAGAAIAASIMGLAGVLVIVWGRMDGPETDSDTAWGIAAVLVSALLYAWNLILLRQQAQVAHPTEIATFQTAFAGLIFACFAPWYFEWPDGPALPWIAAAAVMSIGGVLILSWAYARAEAQVLVPLEYSGFLWAVLFGWLFFREEVTVPTLVGAILIVLGCWIAAPRKPPELTAV